MGFQVFYLLILTCILSGGSAVIITKEETIYALTGSDVTLKCSILQGKETHITQIQWSKLHDGLSKIIALYNPHYGTKYSEVAYNNSASFGKGFCDCWTDFSQTSKLINCTANNLKCKQWVLQLKNVSRELSGSYQCIFTTFPTGTSSSKIHLIVNNRDHKNSVLQALLNLTLEIPCLNSMPRHINLANASLTWLLQKENGSEKILIRKQSYYLQGYTNYGTMYKDRIQMSSKNALLISPVTFIDDGKKFVCSIANLHGRFRESTTQVKVFAKPDISIGVHTDSVGKANFTCVIKKAYPKPELLWYMDGEIVNTKSEGLLIENIGEKRIGRFYERTSFLSIWNTTHSSIIQAFKCMSVYHLTRNERWNISSKEIVIRHDFQTTSLAYSEFINHSTAISDSPTERLQTTFSDVLEVPLVSDSPSEKSLHSTETLQSDGTTKLLSDSTVSQEPSYSAKTLQSNAITKFLSDSTVSQGLKSSKVTIPQNAITATHLQENSMPSQRNLFTRKMTELITLSSPNSYTVKNGLNTTSTIVPKHSTFPWAGVVALLLLFCTFLIICGIRKWYQHQREIMNRPPSFKPPPPPVKYTSIEVYNGIYSSYDELENL